jgi:hypothetical protein
MDAKVTIKIDAGIEMPRATFGRPLRYPWLILNVGDSFAAPNNATPATFRSMACRASKTYGRRFSVRAMPDGSLRCWRVA